MDCKTARLLLELAHPRATELDETEAELLDSHLAECAECGSVAREEARIDDHLGAAVRAVPLPAGLRERLTSRLQAERALAVRTRRLRYWGGLAAAAAVLLAVTGWWFFRPLPVLNLNDHHAQVMPRRAEEVEQFLAERGVRVAAPPQFNYNLLATYHLVEFQGHSRVPHLFFLSGGEFAEVYILTDRQFDRAATLLQPRLDSGGWTVEVQVHPNDTQVFYLIKYTGGSLQRFLTAEGRPTL